MNVEVEPPVTEAETVALLQALAHVGLRLDGASDPYASAWRRAAAEEALDDEREPAPAAAAAYAPSPRSTRGATRA